MASRPVEDENFQYIIDNKIQPSKLPYLSTRQEGSQRTRLAGDKQVKLLLREKEEDNNAVPRSLVSFIETPKFYNFLLALLEYCRELFRLENKQ